MRDQPVYYYPLFFALFSSAIYVAVFVFSWTSEDYTTLMLVFCAGLGWGALIFMKRGKKHFLLNVYMILSILFPLLYIELLHFSKVDPLWHRITFGLMILATLVMNFLISLFLKKKNLSYK